MRIYKKIVTISILSLAVAGCSNNDIKNKEEIPVVETPIEQSNEGEALEPELIAGEDFIGETLEDEAEHTHEHDEGYSELIHGGFSMKFQELMEAIYSRVNYSMMGIAVEDIVPIEESVMTSVEDMMNGLNPIQDGDVLKIVKEARELFDKTNGIIATRKYEQLGSLNEDGQTLYNAYYDWLIEAAKHHKHEE